MRHDRYFGCVDALGRHCTLTTRGTAQEARRLARLSGLRLVTSPCDTQYQVERAMRCWGKMQPGKEAACAR